jgi:hypothetical protein
MLAAGALVCGVMPARTGAQAVQHRTVTLAILPPQTTLDDLAQLNGMTIGVMSTGIGEVPPEQTYLDISQGNRVNDALYDGDLPPVRPFFRRVPNWDEILARAESAPAEIAPGQLASALSDAAISSDSAPAAGLAALVVANREGGIGRDVRGRLTVLSAGPGTVRKLAASLPADGLLIAITEPSDGVELVPIGVVGGGFNGNLTSDSTRTEGYVLSTDIPPTILDRYGLAIPDEMDGEPIRSEGRVDVATVDGLANRMAAIPERRAPVLIACLAAWILVGFAINRIVFGLRRMAMAWLALCFAYMPLMLLAGAWLEPTAVVEALLVGLGAAVLAALTVRFVSGWRGLALACAITVTAYAVDVIAGSGLTRLSLLGPNPIFGARFYGIGNELEALIAVMVPVGVAAALTARWRAGAPVTDGRATAAFVGAAGLGAIVFGAGRLGADVGAAIVLPIGAAVAAASLPRPEISPRKLSLGRQLVVVVVAAPIAAVSLLAVIDLASGGDSHLTRFVFDAGGASDLADVAERRLELSAHDFAQAAGNPLFWIVVVGIVAAVSQLRRIDGWLRSAPIARAGLIGAFAAVTVGVLVNDSGATFLVLGGLALGAALAYAWSQAGEMAPTEREIRNSPRNT